METVGLRFSEVRERWTERIKGGVVVSLLHSVQFAAGVVLSLLHCAQFAAGVVLSLLHCAQFRRSNIQPNP